MSKTYCYSVQVNDAQFPVEFGYDESGLLFELSMGDLFGDYKLTPFGEDGSKLQIDYYVPTGVLGVSWSVYLIFEKTIDFTKPLPLDQFSAADSYYELTPPDISDDPPTILPVQAVTSMTCPPLSEA